MRVALYARVSTEEQVKHGLSIDTQLANLREWASNNNHTIVSEYVDLGISARKNPSKRPALSRLLENLGEIDAVIFTKLDRWTRNIKGYYAVQDQLDKAKVAWIAIQEDYETVTASGRFKVNIMLSVAENEADRTSERIKVVMERKIALGEHIGSRPPFGYSVANKHFVINDDADIVKQAFEAYESSGSIRAVMDYLHGAGHPYLYGNVERMLRNTVYAGRYRTNDHYCEPIIPPEQFDRVQELLKSRSVRMNQTGREYIFSGMITCSCGHKMVASYQKSLPPTRRYRYRCDRHYMHRKCDNGTFVSETKLEEALLSKLEQEIKSMEFIFKPKQKKQKTPDNSKKLERLNELYVEGIISKKEFTARRERLLTPSDPPAPDMTGIQKIALSDNLRESYYGLSKTERRTLWKSIVERIDAVGSKVTVTFRS